MTKPPDTLIKLAVIGAPHGVRGQVKVNSFASDPANLTSYGPLFDSSGEREIALKVTGKAKGQLIASIESVTTREQAEALKGTEIFVPRDALPDTEEEEFYYSDLIGMNVIDASGEAFGTVKSINNYGAGDIIEISHTDGKSEYYSFSKALFPHIDVAAAQITIISPDVIYAKEKEEED